MPSQIFDKVLEQYREPDLSYGSGRYFWDDLVVPLTTSKQGATTKPDFDYTNVGYLFPKNDAAEILYLIVQMPHRWRTGSVVYPHVHWRQTRNEAAVFKIDYQWTSINSAPAGFTTYTMSSYVNTYSSGTLHQISQGSGGIDGAGKGISSIIQIKLYRDDNVYNADALTDQFDLHYQVDSYGSRQEYIK